MSKLIDLNGQDFGYWHVIERAPNDKNGRARWKCQCTLCSTIKEVDGAHLRAGRSTSCGCTKMEKMRQASIKQETGNIYGFLQVIREATDIEKPNNKNGIWWNCTCLKCGQKNVIVKGDYLRNGDTKSCGCLNSVNEAKIAQMLQALNFQFQSQIKFKDLTLTWRACDQLMFDFGVYNKDKLLYIIEFDGSQHFYSHHSGWNNDITLNQTHKSDLAKNKYCFDHNIPLIRIPYNKEYTLNDLKIETTAFLLTPENEEKYYSDNGYK